MKDRITRDDIPGYLPEVIELPHGWTAEVKIEHDETLRAPWDEHDGHGPIREVRYSYYNNEVPKSPGERVMFRDHGYALLYDFAGAMEQAKRDGWGCPHIGKAECAHLTTGEMRACAVDADFHRMRRFAEGQWSWIGVVVTLKDDAGEEVESDSLWGIESDTDYYRDVAAELINGLAAGVILPNYGEEAV
jgi:hypothetical protein